MQKGFTLMEVMVVITIAGILAAIVSLNFNHYTRKQGIESQVKMMYSDLMVFRARSLYENREYGVRLTSNQFDVYSSAEMTGTPVLRRKLAYPLSTSGLELKFNERGIATTNASICVEGSDNAANYDSIVVYTTRIRMGKRQNGSTCSGGNINYY